MRRTLFTTRCFLALGLFLGLTLAQHAFACISDTDCADGYYCKDPVNEQCGADCSAEFPCSDATKTCNLLRGRCETTDGDIDVEDAESEAEAQPDCQSNADCAATKKCSGGFCVPLSPGDCAADMDCADYPDVYCELETRSCRAFCPDDSFCLGAGEYCDPSTHHCLHRAAADGDSENESAADGDDTFCTTASDSCPNGYYCDVTLRSCRKYCTSAADCDLTEVCADRKCVARTTEDGDTDGLMDGDTEAVDIAEGYDSIDEDFEFKDLDSDCPAGQVCIDKPASKSGSGCSDAAGGLAAFLFVSALSVAFGWRRAKHARGIVLLLALFAAWPMSAWAIDTAPSAEKIQAALDRGMAAKNTPEKLYKGYEFGTLGSSVNGYVQSKLCEIALRAAALGAAGKTLDGAAGVKDILQKKHLLIPIYIPAAKETALNDIRVELRQGLKTLPADELLKDPVRRVLCEADACLYARDVFAGFWYEHFDPSRVAVLVVHVGSRFYEFPLAFEQMD